MKIRWLGWAGFEVQAAGASLVVDLLGHPDGVIEDTGLVAPMPPVVSPRNLGEALGGLCTHLHRDHTDAHALADALLPGAPVLHPISFGGDEHENLWTLKADGELTARALPRREMAYWETTTIGPFRIAALPAVDTLGDPQVSWAIEAAGKKIVHLGDSMYHGYWWRIAHRYGPFDAVLTPINGPTVCFPHCQPPSPFPSTLDDRHAAAAVRLLGGKLAIPMHYGGFHVDGLYHTRPDELERFLDACAHETYSRSPMQPGDEIEL